MAAKPTASSAFVAVDVEPERALERAGDFEVTLAGGRSVRIQTDFDAAALSRLLAALEHPC